VEKFIDTTMASVYGQIHDEIEVICIDDGSNDCTLEKLNAWKPFLESKGYTVIVETKENGGAASAINVGLSLFTGEYVCFPDSDDMLMPGYVSDMLACLEENPEEQWVKCKPIVIWTGNDGPFLWSERESGYDDARHLVERYITTLTWPVVWIYMIRAEFLRECLPDMHLEEGWSVQEYQLLLPLAYRKPFFYLDKALYLYTHKVDGFSGKYIHSGYTGAKTYFERNAEVARKVIRKLHVSESELNRLELLINIFLKKNSIYYANLHDETEILQQSINDLWELIVQAFDIKGVANKLYEEMSPSEIRWFAKWVMEVLVYDKNELEDTMESKSEHLSGKVFLYGAGVRGQTLVPMLLRCGIDIEGIWDQNAGSIDKDISGIPVIAPDFSSISDRDKQRMTVIISIYKPEYAQEAMELIKRNGFVNIIKYEDIEAVIRTRTYNLIIKPSNEIGQKEKKA